MKTGKILIVMALVLLVTLCGCNLETSDNGDLDGMWHIVAVDTIDGGTLDLSEQRRYWDFQAKLLQLHDADESTFLIMRFNHTGDSLILSEPRINDRDLGDTLITDISQLTPFGINNFQESFYVEQLSSGKMVLRSKKLTLQFKKF